MTASPIGGCEYLVNWGGFIKIIFNTICFGIGYTNDVVIITCLRYIKQGLTKGNADDDKHLTEAD